MRHRKISLILTVIATLSFMLFNQGCIPGAGIQQQSQHENARKLQEQIPAQKYFSSSYVKLIDLNGGDIYPGEKLKALITVINNSSLEVKDVTLEVDIPDVLIADFNLQGFLIESIEAGQEKIIEIPLRVAPDIDKDFTGHIQAVIDRGKDTQYFSEKISFTVFGTAPYIRDKIPIIGLHGIEDSIEIPIELSTYYFDYLCMTLKEFGFETITFKDLFDHIDFGRVLPEKSVIITSDDGFESLYKNAFPILKKYDYKMTVFLATNYIKETEEKRTKNYFDSDRPVPMRPMLIWPEVIEMDSYGCEFLSHSANHIRMGLADEEVFLNELTVSKEDIESRLKKDVLFFAWPYDNHSEEKWPLIEKAGYRGAVRYWGGVEHISRINLMEIKRLEFNSYISPADYVDYINLHDIRVTASAGKSAVKKGESFLIKYSIENNSENVLEINSIELDLPEILGLKAVSGQGDITDFPGMKDGTFMWVGKEYKVLAGKSIALYLELEALSEGIAPVYLRITAYDSYLRADKVEIAVE